MNAKDTMRVAETAEAVCGMLARLHFDFLGESNGGASTWFIRGSYPKDIRIEVVRSVLAPMVLINTEFRNISDGQRRIGRITGQIDVRGSKPRVMIATEKAVVRVLEIFRDVLEQTGVAGPNAGKPLPTVDSADIDAPETADEEKEAGL